MKVIIAGSRDFNNYQILSQVCNFLLKDKEDIEIVSGTAKGADRLGEQYAKQHNYPLALFPADWDKHGKKAGYIRNEEMAKYSDMLIAFWNGESKGTKHMIDLARKHGLRVEVVDYKDYEEKYLPKEK